MFDNLAAYFHENIVFSYVAYLEVRNNESFGISKDLRTAILAPLHCSTFGNTFLHHIYLGRITRELRRKTGDAAYVALEELLQRSERLLQQKKHDTNKLYSCHAPEVECISKGKTHKKYEFGCKVSVATTSRDNWIVGVQAHHGNPYDDHTLDGMLKFVNRNIYI